jgi:hypothetical protein
MFLKGDVFSVAVARAVVPSHPKGGIKPSPIESIKDLSFLQKKW